LEDVSSPLEITSVLRSGQGFKLRTLDDPNPRTLHGNLIVVDGQSFLWRPNLRCPHSGVLDITPESWGIFDVVAPKPGMLSWFARWLMLEIVVLGTGDRIMSVRRVRETLAKLGMQVDVQDTVRLLSMALMV